MTSGRSLIPPLVVEFEVGASREQAFATWVERIELWWPRGHTVSGNPRAIVFEPHVGGRIYELGNDDVEHSWGEVAGWDPPGRVEYLWHLFFPRAEATHVVVTFDQIENGTRVRIEQSGWDALGEQGPGRRDRTVAGWGAVIEQYRRTLAGSSNNEGVR
jgi:hypothetical protein